MAGSLYRRFLLQAPLTMSQGVFVLTGCRHYRSTHVQFAKTDSAGSASTESRTSSSISKAMQSYMERAEAHHTFMEEQRQEFALGRRHLANMMGKDPETFTQDDINEAIRYLFPSGLFQIKARPRMRPPEELYPKQKDAEFDSAGRPFHPFFYTTKPNFFYLIHDMVNRIQRMNTASGLNASPEQLSDIKGFMNGTKWISKEELEAKLLEKLSDQHYNDWQNTMERMADHDSFPLEYEFVKQYRTPLASVNVVSELPPVEIEPDGRKKVTMLRCGKKTSKAQVTVRYPGTGEFSINGRGLDFYDRMQSREMVISPLQRVGWLGKVDVEATVKGRGESNNAVAVRYGIANCIAALGADVEALRLAGYLTHDRRRREKKKPGRVGARAFWTWRKR